MSLYLVNNGALKKGSVLLAGQYNTSVDVDYFYQLDEQSDQSVSLPVFNSGKSSEIEFRLDKEASLELPLIMVSVNEDSPEPLMKAAAVPGTYVAMYEVILHVKYDGSNEEYELYSDYVDAGGESTDILSSTSHLFNGGTRNDASGISKVYTDVNNKDVWYSMHSTSNGENGIALLTLTLSDIRSLVSIEDDVTTGVHRRKTSQNPISETVKYYDVSNNELTDQSTSFNLGSETSSDPDNPYLQSGIKNIRQDYVNARIVAQALGDNKFRTDRAGSNQQGKLGHVNYILKMTTIQ